MQLVTPYAKILTIHGQPASEEAGIAALKFVEWCGRVSHASEDKQTDDSWSRFITAVVLEHGDWSITEHVNVTVDFLIDRGVSHELVRHRLCAFTQSSTRFINYAKKMPPTFVLPDLKPVSQTSWEVAIDRCEETYKQLLEDGYPPQIARSVFPNALSTRVVTTANLRNWRHILIMRTTKEAHPQFRQVTIPLLEEFKRLIPILYDDIEPLAKQSEGMKRAR